MGRPMLVLVSICSPLELSNKSSTVQPVLLERRMGFASKQGYPKIAACLFGFLLRTQSVCTTLKPGFFLLVGIDMDILNHLRAKNLGLRQELLRKRAQSSSRTASHVGFFAKLL